MCCYNSGCISKFVQGLKYWSFMFPAVFSNQSKWKQWLNRYDRSMLSELKRLVVKDKKWEDERGSCHTVLKDLGKPCLIFVKALSQHLKNQREQSLWCYFGGWLRQSWSNAGVHKQDEKLMVSIHLVIGLSESSLKHYKSIFTLFLSSIMCLVMV